MKMETNNEVGKDIEVEKKSLGKIITRENMHAIMGAYLQEHSLVESNILSFNDFIDRRLQKVINEINEDLPREDISVWLGKIKIGKPQLIEADGSIRNIFPIEARLRKLTYSAPIEIELSADGKDYTSFEIGKIPVMVKSKLCNLSGMSKAELIKNYEDPADSGGYFIVNGNERALVMIEDLAQNRPSVEKTAKGVILKLYSSRGSYRIPITIYQTAEGSLFVDFSRFKNLPAVLLIKALGIIKDSEIASLIGDVKEDILFVNLYEWAKIQNKEGAILAIAGLMNMQGNEEEVIERVQLRIDSAFLSHIGTKPESRIEKAAMLCKLVKQYLISKQLGLESDKDHYANKRVRLSGDLLTDLFRVNLTIFIRDLQRNLQKIAKKKKFYSIKSLAKSTLFSHRIESAFATGNWIGQRTGVTQNIDKTNRVAMISQLQRVISLLPSEQENFKARTLHPTHYGRFCPIETPEGTAIGLRKNLAMLTKMSTVIEAPDKEIISTFEKIGLQPFNHDIKLKEKNIKN